MRFLVLSDIHGNNIALQKVLSTVSPDRYDKIIVLGDCVGDGPCPDKVLSILMAYDSVIIQGNREILACEHYNGSHVTKEAQQWDFMRRTLSYLNDDMWRLLTYAPPQHKIYIDDMSLIMCHGSPFFVREILCPHYPSRLNASLEHIKENMLLCGHNHIQYAHHHDDKIALNPGSVGLCQTGEHCRADYAILELRNDQYSFELNHTYYDGEQIKKEFESRGLFENGIWGKIVYKEMSEGKMYISGFARFVINMAKNAGHSTEPIPNDIWEEASSQWDWLPA